MTTLATPESLVAHPLAGLDCVGIARHALADTAPAVGISNMMIPRGRVNMVTIVGDCFQCDDFSEAPIKNYGDEQFTKWAQRRRRKVDKQKKINAWREAVRFATLRVQCTGTASEDASGSSSGDRSTSCESGSRLSPTYQARETILSAPAKEFVWCQNAPCPSPAPDAHARRSWM